MRINHVLAVLVAAAFLFGCGSSSPGSNSEEDAYQAEDLPLNWKDDNCFGVCLTPNLWVPGHFNYDLTNDFVVEVTVLQLDGNPWADVVVSVYDDQYLPGDQTLLARGMTDANGKWEGPVVVPSYQTAVNVVASIMGARNRIRVSADTNPVVVTFGGEE